MISDNDGTRNPILTVSSPMFSLEYIELEKYAGNLLEAVYIRDMTRENSEEFGNNPLAFVESLKFEARANKDQALQPIY
jgi:hypothetical protein